MNYDKFNYINVETFSGGRNEAVRHVGGRVSKVRADEHGAQSSGNKKITGVIMRGAPSYLKDVCNRVKLAKS